MKKSYNKTYISSKVRAIILVIGILMTAVVTVNGQSTIKIALIKYAGGGDWYANPTSLPNLIEFCNENLGTTINPEPATVEVGSTDIYAYPFVHLTGHGNIQFNDEEAQNLRTYLLSGGFLHIDDNYGLDKHIRVAMKKVFPELEFVELPFTHPIYHSKYKFPDGLPKIHEHDNKPPQGFGLIWEGRLICFYTYECALGDGWEHTSVHNDTQEAHLQALKMGANIISYVFGR
ncbi:MAG: DUF4159 domain-containing protein [Bacteroidales bacterium]|nr:DUF4159 domain-containing protein [Bacteroidales bacterium]